MDSVSGSVVPHSWPAVIIDGLGVRLSRASFLACRNRYVTIEYRFWHTDFCIILDYFFSYSNHSIRYGLLRNLKQMALSQTVQYQQTNNNSTINKNLNINHRRLNSRSVHHSCKSDQHGRRY
jgi:hypothetical protein